MTIAEEKQAQRAAGCVFCFVLFVPLRAVAVLERAGVNRIERISGAEALPVILNQTLRPEEPEEMDRLLALCDRLARAVPFYRLGCTPDPEAADVACEAMR